MDVAVKDFSVLAQTIREEKLVKEILREAVAQAQVAPHENVVNVIKGEPEQGHIILELLPTSLERELPKRPEFSQQETLAIAKGILEGLRTIHEKDIVHGDLKPANILMTGRGIPKISDFGMASILTEKKFPLPFFHGSNDWLAPEVLKGAKPSYQSDLFSFGIIFCLLTTKRHPFYKEDPTCLSGPEDCIKDPEFVMQLPSEIPVEISQIIEKCLQREAGDRYKAVDEALMALSQLEAPTASPSTAEVTEGANTIASAVVEAKRSFAVEFDPRAALEILEAVVRRPELQTRFLANAYSYKAFVHNYLREWKESEEAASRGIQLDATHVDSYMARGYARMRRGVEDRNADDLQCAVEDFERAQVGALDHRKRQQVQRYIEHCKEALN